MEQSAASEHQGRWRRSRVVLQLVDIVGLRVVEVINVLEPQAKDNPRYHDERDVAQRANRRMDDVGSVTVLA